VVRPLARRRAAQPDRRDARARKRASDAARDQHRHHLAIDHRGHELARLPWFTRGILEVEITGRQGTTPYVRWGDALPLAAAAAILAIAWIAGGRPITVA